MTQKSEEEIRIEKPEDAEEQLAKANTPRPRGRPLIFRVAEHVLDTHRDRLRAAFPEAVLRPIPPRRPYTLDRPVAYDGPRWISPRFRELPPCKRLDTDAPPGGGYTITYVGSGVPAAEHPLAKDWFARCMNCGGTDTRIIYASSSTHYGRVERWTWDECEYECRECGKFNFHQVHEEG